MSTITDLVPKAHKNEEDAMELAFQDLILDHYDIHTTVLPASLYMSEEPYWHVPTVDVQISEDNVDIVQHSEEGVIWSFTIEDEITGFRRGSEATGTRKSEFRQKYKIRHNFVSESLSIRSTDEKLKTYFGSELDPDDHLTPDLIWKDAMGTIHVVEVSTTRNDSHEGVTRVYKTKEFKYRSALESRVMKGYSVTFTIIVVSHSMVLSTIRLHKELTNELIARMRIGVCLEDLAKSKGFTFETDESDFMKTELGENIQAQLEKCNWPTVSHPLDLGEEFCGEVLGRVDEAEVFRVHAKCIKETEQDGLISKEMTSEENIDNRIRNYIESNCHLESRQHQKACVNLPLFLAEETDPSSDIPDLLLHPSVNVPESELWSIALDKYKSRRDLDVLEDPRSLLREALEEDHAIIKSYEDGRKASRPKYHRVSLRSSLTGYAIQQLALQGVWAKRLQGEEFIKTRRRRNQLPFHWNTETGDVESFLEMRSLLKSSVGGVGAPDEEVLNLLTRAQALSENPNTGTEVVKEWMSTDLFKSLNLISDIGMELAISNKQNCKDGDGIVKKLRHYNAYILIIPTKSSEHAFFTLYFPKGRPLCELPFRKLYKLEFGYVTPVVSVKQGKLENWCSASSSLISLAAFWSWFYELDGESPKFFKGEQLRMLLLSLLIRLEDKACTEEAITQMRYCYMEVFKSSFTPLKPDPLKMLAKFSTNFRSRLQLWVVKRGIESFRTMCLHPPMPLVREALHTVEGEEALPKDAWSGLLNIFTGVPVMSASKIINLMYLGYLKNKNESAEGNTDFGLIEKTVEEEMTLDWEEIEYSQGFCPYDKTPKGKQFSRQCIMHGCEQMESKLTKRLGRNWRDLIGQEVLQALSSQLTEELATLKASSSVEHESTQDEASFTDSLAAMRIKVIEALSQKLQVFKLNPFCHLEKVVSYIETTSRGVIADLFKKQQHGGLREIYVLTIESRIVQLFIETISRKICSYFEEETLTHPGNKLRKLNEHRILAGRKAKEANASLIDFCNSSDKTRWNQNFVMTAMAIPLIRMTPKAFHPMICRILNMWTRKLIRIPQSVVLLLLNNRQVSSPAFRQLHTEFWKHDRESRLNPVRCGKFVQLSSGMMQGILHYTSSLLHLSFLYSSNRVIRHVLKIHCTDCQILLTQVCSSDDSATVLSVITEGDSKILSYKELTKFVIASLVVESLSRSCRYYCMINSPKTTASVPNYVEFNSEFLFDNTIAMPVIKFVAASLTLSESESFLSRFHTCYNLVSDAFASGLTSAHTHLLQLAQGMYHYKTMGSSTNPLFPEWAKQVTLHPDPIYGFFLVDCDLMPGTLGYSFSHWMAARNSDIFRKNPREVGGNPWVTTPEGGILQTLVMKHGDNKRWKRLIERVKGDTDIRSEVDKDPSILFRVAKTAKELQLKLALKATSPGVGKSMCRGNPFMQAIAMSVYAINTHSFSKVTVTQEFGSRFKYVEKVCILGELTRINSDKHIRTPPPVDTKSMDMAFPNFERYEESLTVIERMRRAELIRCPEFRNRKTEVVVQNNVSSIPLRLPAVVNQLWFGATSHASKSVFTKCVQKYQEILPWLKGTIQETLDNSPFDSYQELVNFVNAERVKSRMFKRNGPGLYSRRLKGQIFNLIRKSVRPRHVLKEAAGKEYTASDKDLVTRLNLALCIPDEGARRTLVREILMTGSSMANSVTDIERLTRRDGIVAYIQGIMRGTFSVSDVAIHLRDVGMGVHVSYITEQRRVTGADGPRWVGPGECVVTLEGIQCRLQMEDDVLLSIRVEDLKRLRTSLGAFKDVIRELGLRALDTTAARPGCMARFNGASITPHDNVGTPIFPMKEYHRVKYDTDSLRVNISLNYISLEQPVYSRSGYLLFSVTVLKYRQSPRDVMLDQKGETTRDLWTAWVDQSPCSPDTLLQCVYAALNKQSRPLKEWLKESLQCRLSFRNLSDFNISFYDLSKASESVSNGQDDEIDDEEIRQIMDDLFEKARSSEAQSQQVLGRAGQDVKDWVDASEEEMREQERLALENLFDFNINVSIPDWVPCVRNWNEVTADPSVSIMMPSQTNVMTVHPLWDSLINGFMEETPQFWRSVSEGRVIAGQEITGKLFMDLLGIRQNVRPGFSMVQRLQLAKKAVEERSPVVSFREDSDDDTSESKGGTSDLEGPGVEQQDPEEEGGDTDFDDDLDNLGF